MPDDSMLYRSYSPQILMNLIESCTPILILLISYITDHFHVADDLVASESPGRYLLSSEPNHSQAGSLDLYYSLSLHSGGDCVSSIAYYFVLPHPADPARSQVG